MAAFQFRVKDIDQHAAALLAEPLQRICADADVAFIINDSVALAKRLGADGVHLGQGDGDPREARAELGATAQIGVTCHDSRHLAMEAGEGGADYVAFGAFYPTQTKVAEHRPDPSILSWWATNLRDTVGRDRRYHAGQCGCIGEGGGGFPRGLARRLGRGRSGGDSRHSPALVG